jgi:hypothetical protein
MCETFDIRKFQSVLSNPDLLAPDGLYGDVYAIAGPRDLLAIESVRSALNGENLLSGAVECDLFVFGRGTPNNPHCTKIGGLPYRRRDVPWPTYRDDHGIERDFDFLAQFSFAESSDIVSAGGHDLLLLFVKQDDFYGPGAYFAEWSDGAISPDELWTAAKPPHAVIPQLYGLRHRCHDYRECNASLPVQHYYLYRHIQVARGIKIGGLPTLPPPAEGLRFLCQLAALTPKSDTPFPWCNHELPIAWEDTADENLSVVDNGVLCLFLDDRDGVVAQFDCA